ncbi:MAG TPA: hypothetical protein VMH41_12095 [Mycobacteriales bacterium]|nr:hypothetical protein [Mycobacteriales bacterium]
MLPALLAPVAPRTGRGAQAGSVQIGIVISEESELRRALIHALDSRVIAQLVPLVDDATLSVRNADLRETLRTLVFEADHRAVVTVRSIAEDIQSVEFATTPSGAFDIELSANGKPERTALSDGREPVSFTGVTHGPVRFVYSLPGAGGLSVRHQTEWFLLP